MSEDTILAELRQKRAVMEKERDSLSLRITQLTTAIAAIEGKTSDQPVVETSVITVCEQSLAAFAPGHIIDTQDIRRESTKLRPDMEQRIGRGVYSAIAQLIKRGQLKKVPGGLMLNQPLPVAVNA